MESENPACRPATGWTGVIRTCRRYARPYGLVPSTLRHFVALVWR